MKRKRRTKAEIEAQKGQEKLKEKIKKGEIDQKELLLSSLPKQQEKEIIYIDKPMPVIKEVRIVKDNQNTEMTVTEIIKQELDIVDIWEFLEVPINQINTAKLKELGNKGWKFAFDISPDISPTCKETKLIFQKPKLTHERRSKNN